MRKKRRSVVFWFSLLVYGLMLTGVLLYVRFPITKVEDFLTERISRLTNGAAVEIGQCEYGLPAELQCDRLVFVDKEKRAEVIVLENISISPVASGLGLKYEMAGEVAGGTFRSVAVFSPVAGTVKLENLDLIGIDLSRSVFVTNVFQREIRGLLDFNGSLVASLDGDGLLMEEGKLSVRDGDFALRQPILLVDRLQMAPLDARLVYDNGTLQLGDGSLRGNQMLVTFAGELNVNETMADWEVLLTGNMIPAQEYVAATPQVQRVVKRMQRQFKGNSLPYKVSGSLGAPRFRFGSQ